MMRRQMTLIRACVLAIAVLVVWPSNMVAQQPDDEGPRHERRRGRGPEQLRERIQDLRDEGVADDDPRPDRNPSPPVPPRREWLPLWKAGQGVHV